MRDWFEQYLKADDVEISTAADYQAARKILQAQGADCMVLDAVGVMLDPSRPTADTDEDSALDFLPILAYGDGAEARTVEGWRALARNSMCGRSVRRTAAEQASFSCTEISRRCPNRIGSRSRLHATDEVLRGQAMIVDDDMRNIFALTSLRKTRDDHRIARQRARRDPVSARSRRCRRAADGHHDAGNGRHRNDP
jgi:hypothetical protein